MGIATLVVVATELAERTHTAQPEAPPALVKLREYLVAYEPRLAELIAEERFVQYQEGSSRRRRTRRVMVSEISFLRLPGSRVWLGQRRVQRLDGRRMRRRHRPSSTCSAPAATTCSSAQRPSPTTTRGTIWDIRAASTSRRSHLSCSTPGTRRPSSPQRDALRSFGAVRCSSICPARSSCRHASSAIEDVRFNRTDVRASVMPESRRDSSKPRSICYPPVPLRFGDAIRSEWPSRAIPTLEIFVPAELEERAPRLSGRSTYAKFKRFRNSSARIVP